jgi:redox-sensitive bicupin YhaK (pirin superfamily)
MEDWFPRGVFDRHPHRGMETATYVIDGRLDHYDNYGNKGALLPGNVQWMTAGRGIIHNEQPPAGATVHSLQLWVNLPAAAAHDLKKSPFRVEKMGPLHFPGFGTLDASVK